MRKFGLEVEFGGSQDAAIEALRLAGLSSRTTRAGYIGHSDSEWIVKSDGSVPRGGEMVGPPLNFDDESDREQVTRAINAIRDAGCTTSEAAGIHIHVDASDLTPEQIAYVVRSFAKFEDVIYRIASSGWTTIRHGARQYARPLAPEVVQRLSKCKTMDQLGRTWYGGGRDWQYQSSNHGDMSRYAGLNLHSWFYRKTIEFRVFNSSLNPERVQGYIAICVALVEDARRNNRRSIGKCYALGGMLSGSTNEKNAFHRFQQVLRYEAGMSLDDMKRVTRIWKDSRPQSTISSLY